MTPVARIRPTDLAPILPIHPDSQDPQEDNADFAEWYSRQFSNLNNDDDDQPQSDPLQLLSPKTSLEDMVIAQEETDFARRFPAPIAAQAQPYANPYESNVPRIAETDSEQQFAFDFIETPPVRTGEILNQEI